MPHSHRVWVHALQRLHDWTTPSACLLCAARLPARRYLCADCDVALPWLGLACARCATPLHHAGVCGQCQARPPRHDTATAALRYAAPVAQWVQQLKFHRALAHARLMGELLARRLPALPAVDAIVPVPLHTGRLRMRGFNQALEIARPLAKRYDLPLVNDALLRTRATAAQTELPRARRRANVRKAFTARDMVKGLRIAVVDDVMTTGSTLDDAAAALKRAGASEVHAWVVARA